MDGPEYGNFTLLYVVKMSLRGWVVQKSLKTPLRTIKMTPYHRLQTMLLILRLRPKVSLQLNPISVIVEVNMFCLGSINYYVRTDMYVVQKCQFFPTLLCKVHIF